MASKPVANLLFNTIRRPLKTISPSILRPYSRLPLTLQPAARRFAHTIPKPPGQASSSPSEKQRRRMLSEPHYQLRFTCVPCGNRSAHTVSKIGYHHGSVLITCPSCRNRHIISDHLNIFGDRKITVEDLMREKGQLVKRGTLGEHGDVEFWADSIGDDAADSQPSPANAQESDASVEEVKREEVIKSRETRDPSSQSMDPKPRASASLGDAGARPSVGGSHHTNPISSTRRQYSTAQQSNTLRASSSGPDFFGMPRGDVSSYGRTSRLPEQHLASLRKYPSRAALRDALSERRSTLTQVSRKEMLREKHRIFVRRRHPKRTERRSMLTPVSKEKMLEKRPRLYMAADTDYARLRVFFWRSVLWILSAKKFGTIDSAPRT
ncbi:DNL zinc finger-domain-containing protein [Annulohypoxylon bovei var. microspora]|nr:DNL zinc finger-domain-containing protein [Annulohypoxylon bovei var. microspora]